MKLNPYLNFPGTCQEAMTNYAKVLGGEIVAMMTYGDMPGDHPIPDDMRKKIAHARLIVGDQVLMASDAGPDRFKPMQGTSVTLNIPEPAEAERVFNALVEGGNAIMPLDETFWARKFGVLVDRFGTQWMVNCEKPKP
ncbi:MAG: VOC family protein [Hyphomicrobiales bacterium]